MPKVSYIYFTYRIRARGFRAIMGDYGGISSILGGRVRQTVVLWTVGGRSGRLAGVFGRVFPVRACGGVPLPLPARDQSQCVYPIIVYGGGIGESVVSVGECG